MVRLLLEAGVPPGLADDDGDTPLRMARRFGLGAIAAALDGGGGGDGDGDGDGDDRGEG